MKILFCNIGWMERYDGIGRDSIKGGGSYNNEFIGLEICNFSNIDGHVYGYVQPPTRQVRGQQTTPQIHIENLGVDKNKEFVKGVTVIWTAPDPVKGTVIVGWYKNAVVYRNSKTIKKVVYRNSKTIKEQEYWVKALALDAILLPTIKRIFKIPRGKNGMGQSNVWYANKLENAEFVARVYRFVESGGEQEHLPDVDGIESAFEGKSHLVTHLYRERNLKIVADKKRIFLENTGSLRCEACGFDFHEVYGINGQGFCEVHHRQPLHQSEGVVKTELEDLAIVCSNCHRIIHRIDPMHSIQELKEIIRIRANDIKRDL